MPPTRPAFVGDGAACGGTAPTPATDDLGGYSVLLEPRNASR